MLSKSTLAVAAALGASVVQAHIIMVDPLPYSYTSWDNSPLLEDGSNFPCKITGDYTVTQENYMAKGETQYLKFQGSATHGGGSCQISITPDRAPTKETEWSVIMSIEGGCMDPNTLDVNIGDNAKMETPFSPNFTLPDSIEPGQYTLAWTWFNRIGNREMYMNCAPITVTDGSSSSKRSETVDVEKRASEEFPPMFIANINGCKTKHNFEIRFPNPGDNVVHFGSPEKLIPDSAHVCEEGAPTWGTAGFSSGGGSVPQPTATGTEPSTSAPAEGPTASVSVSIGIGAPDFTPGPIQPSQPGVFVPTTTDVQTVAPAPTSSTEPQPTGSESTSGALSGPCTSDGEWNCIGGSSFQRCASGTWSEVQQLATGTECTPGQGIELSVKAAAIQSRMLKEKRSRKRAHGHGIHA